MMLKSKASTDFNNMPCNVLELVGNIVVKAFGGEPIQKKIKQNCHLTPKENYATTITTPTSSTSSKKKKKKFE